MSEQTLSPMTIGLRLFLICTAAALGLGFVNEITEPRIAAQKTADRDQVIRSFVDKGTIGAPVAGNGVVEAYYPVLDGESVLGYVARPHRQRVRRRDQTARLLWHRRFHPHSQARRELRDAGSRQEGRDRPVHGDVRRDGRRQAGPREQGDARRGRRFGAAAGRGRLCGARPVVSRRRGPAWAPGFSAPRGGAGGGGGAADAVTGATITFKGVSGALAEGSRFAKGLKGAK